MTNEVQPWLSYEQVVTDILNKLAEEFDFVRVEGKQTALGLKSGTAWEIDAKGVCSTDGAFFIVECRRHTTSRLSQEQVGALAYRILDTGASGGIIVSPLGLQEGAEKIACAENIISVTLNPDSTIQNYMIAFLDKMHRAMSAMDEAFVTETATLQAVMSVADEGVCTESFGLIIYDEQGNFV